MTLYEAIIEYQYNITINCTINNDDDKSIEYNTTVPVWYWDINGGYSSVGSKYYKSASEA